MFADCDPKTTVSLHSRLSRRSFANWVLPADSFSDHSPDRLGSMSISASGHHLSGQFFHSLILSNWPRYRGAFSRNHLQSHSKSPPNVVPSASRRIFASMDSKVPFVTVGSVLTLIGMFLSFPNALATQLKIAISFDCCGISRMDFTMNQNPEKGLQDWILSISIP